MSDLFSNRLVELHRVVKLTDVPTDTTLSDVVARAVDCFRQPPLSAGIAEDEVMVVLYPQHRGQYYESWGLPRRRRWATHAVGAINMRSRTVREMFLHKSDFSVCGLAKGPNQSFILNIGPSVLCCTELEVLTHYL